MQYPIYLIGYMGAGKTTVGKILAQRLGWHFVDLDEAFGHIHGYTPAEYIREFGIEAFRKKEKYVLEDIADQSPYSKVVYATGGGYPCWEDNMECLKELGTGIYLQWTVEQLAHRLMLTDLSNRPMLQGKTEQQLLECIREQFQAREPFYLQADYIISAPQGEPSPEDDGYLAERIYQLITTSL